MPNSWGQAYIERAPAAALGDLVRTVWIQRVGAEPYPQRNLPTGGAELHCPIGELPRLVGPLTRASVDVLAPATILVGVRFLPGGAAALLGLPAAELVDLTVPLDEIWGEAAVILAERLAAAPAPEAALSILQRLLIDRRNRGPAPDPLVSEAVRRLMPWQGYEVGSLGAQLSISDSQLRRRCLTAVGIGPKALQRTLRFQGFLALLQANRRLTTGLADLAAEAGYADHAHLSRECLRLTGLTPRAFLNDSKGKCGCGHDHSASYLPMLRARFVQAPDRVAV